MNKKDFREMEYLRKELKYLNEKQENLSKKPLKVVQDSISTSSSEFPYTRHTTVIEGIENPKNIRKYRKMIKETQLKLENKIKELEYFLKNIDDAEMRLLLRYKYQDGLNYIQIAMKMNNEKNKEYTEEAVRKKIERFFKKI